MLKLADALKAWGSPGFEKILKDSIEKLEPGILPLQQALTLSSHVSDAPISVVVLRLTETAQSIQAKTGIFYAGIIAGSCCSDDPTPVSENTEYCEVLFEIDKDTAGTMITLLDIQKNPGL